MRTLDCLTLAGVCGLACGVVAAGASGDTPSPGALRLEGGIAHHQVLQRDDSGSASARLEGSAAFAGRGAIHATVSHRGNPLDGFSGLKAGAAEGGRWTADIRDLPTGGPYRIDLELRDEAGRPQAETGILDVLVGDLWLLAGQSNMQGQADLADAEQSSGGVHVFDMADRWMIAEEPLHRLTEAIDPVYKRSKGEDTRVQKKGAGLGLPFAKEIFRHTGVPIGLIPCALGGTAISLWDPALQAKGGASLYGATLRRFRASGGKIKGVLWYQGEADARSPEAVPLYGERLRGLISALRRDFGQPDLPFHFAQLGRMLDWVYFGVNGDTPPPRLEQQWMDFREIQRQADMQVNRTAMAVTVDLELGDSIHLSTRSLQRLGIRLARLALIDVYGKKDWPAGPRLDSVRFDAGARVIHVRYTGVNGSLQPAGRISGFSLHREDGSEVAALYRADVDPAHPDTVVLRMDTTIPPDARLAYGWGTNPYCNLVDAADMAAPCFGPLPLREKTDE